MYKMYGIPNCDKVKLARKALEAKGIEYSFIDFKKIVPTKKDILAWKEFLGELPINKRGTTFRKFKEEFEQGTDAQKIKLMIENSSSIKRPILEYKAKPLQIGFDKDFYKTLK